MFVWSKLSSETWRDAWEERFLGPGQTNTVITALPGGKKIRVEVYCARQSEARKIQTMFGGSVRQVKKEEWAKPPADLPPPLHIRGMLVVTNALEANDAQKTRDARPGVPVLHVPPGLAFGTGDHATTSTCLRVLADYAKEQSKAGRPWDMADLGTGTGILAMAASVFGAGQVYAMDFDPHAIRCARANIRRNRCRGIRLEQADLTVWKPERQYDFIAANVFADVLTLSVPVLREALAPGGKLVISGILRAHWPELEAAARTGGLDFPEVRTKGKWVTAVAQRAAGKRKRKTEEAPAK